MKKTRIMGVLILGLLLLNGVVAFASNIDRPFTSFSLPANNGNNYCVSRQKVTGNDWSYVKCTGLNNTSKVTFWIANADQTRISETVSIGISDYFYIMDYTVDRMTGDWVRLGMENYYASSNSASVSGLVDYE